MPLRRIAIVVAAVLVLPACIASETQSEGPALSERLQQSDCEGAEAALDVTSEQMTFDRDTHTFIFKGNVRVKRCNLTIDCDHLRVIRDADENTIKQVIATGNVRFQDGTRHAVAERADYYEADQKLVLVGNPRAWDSDEQNELIGDEIIVFLEEERILVKGARVRFHPNQSPGSEP
jgi:lipopolysaccharide export system protein LptA